MHLHAYSWPRIGEGHSPGSFSDSTWELAIMTAFCLDFSPCPLAIAREAELSQKWLANSPEQQYQKSKAGEMYMIT